MIKKALLIVLFVIGLVAGISSVSSTHLDPLISYPVNASYPFINIDVFYEDQNEVIRMDLEDYVKNVVASEMPASFHIEALKAQAVLARTYAIRKMLVFGGNPSLPGKADVTSNAAKDQAWAPEQVIKERWGIVSSWINWPKMEKAADLTQGLILTYKGLPAEAVYHSTCGGRTEDAQDVWGNSVDYLQSVVCDFCHHSPHYQTSQTVLTSSQISESLDRVGLSVPASKILTAGGIAVTSLSPTGRVKQLDLNGKTVRGVEFRSALNLKSTKFTWSVSGDDIIFNVSGYGHGVGMCQYGANGAAKEGYDFLDILSYYYPETDVVRIFEE